MTEFDLAVIGAGSSVALVVRLMCLAAGTRTRCGTRPIIGRPISTSNAFGWGLVTSQRAEVGALSGS